MARSFIGFGQKPYIGMLQSFPNFLFAGALVIPAQFFWLAYGATSAVPNINVLVDMKTVPKLKDDFRIRSVWIDNLGSIVPVYIYFPDTGYTVVAKPNSCNWYPAITNGRQAWVVGMGFTTGLIPVTNVLFSDALMTPYSDVEIDQAVALWRASPAVTRGNTIYNSAFNVPALGDQTQQLEVSLLAPFSTPLWGTPYPSGIIIITNLWLSLWQVAATPSQSIFITIESTGIAGLLYLFTYWVNPNAVNIVPIYQMNGGQIQLDATQSWILKNVNTLLSISRANLITNFTYIP